MDFVAIELNKKLQSLCGVLKVILDNMYLLAKDFASFRFALFGSIKFVA